MSKEAPPAYDHSPPGVYPPGIYPPPPHHGGPPPMHAGPPQQQTVIVQSPAPPLILGPSPVQAYCPHCHAQITTTVDTEPNTKTHLFAVLMCAFGCWLCCCLPYCMDSCQSQKHYCPNCRAYLGTYSD